MPASYTQGRNEVRWRPEQKTNSAPPWSKFGAPMIKSEFFRRQIYCIEESNCDIVGTFLFGASSSNAAPLQWFSAPIVNWRPGNCAPLATPRYAPACTKRQSSYPHGHPTCWASLQRSQTVSSTPCPGACTSASLSTSAHPFTGWERTAFQIETPICTSHTTIHQFIWQQQQQKCGGLGGSPMECEVVGQYYESLYFHPRHRHPPSWNGPAKKAWVRLDRFRLTEIGHGHFCGSSTA